LKNIRTKTLVFTDAVSFVVMEKLGIGKAPALDEHFPRWGSSWNGIIYKPLEIDKARGPCGGDMQNPETFTADSELTYNPHRATTRDIV
jgi:hypothetical protein